MTTQITIPQLNRKRVPGIDSAEEMNLWSTGVDDVIDGILRSLGSINIVIGSLTRSTSSTELAPHAGQHLPNGSDPLSTAAPSGGFGAAAGGSANSFLRSDAVFPTLVKADLPAAIAYEDEANIFTVSPQTLNDNIKLSFGTGNDSEIYYDGTDLIIDPKVVGSGTVNIPGTVETDGFMVAIVAKTGAYTLTDDDHTVTCDTSGGAFTITLPPLSGRLGRRYNIKNDGSSTNAITIDGDGSETIDGSTTVTFSTLYLDLQVQAGASEWHIL